MFRRNTWKSRLFGICLFLVSLFAVKPMVLAADLPDLIITDLTWDPAAPVIGDPVRFSIVVKNVGTGATPTDIICGVGFQVDGQPTSFWSDNYRKALLPGTSVTLTVTGGVNGSTWTAAAGTHTISAWVNDVGRFPESDLTNNAFQKTTPNIVAGVSTVAPKTATNGLAGAYYLKSKPGEQPLADKFNELKPLLDKAAGRQGVTIAGNITKSLNQSIQKSLEQLVQYPITKYVIGKQSSAPDISDSFGVFWDDSNLYVLVNVTDSVKFFNQQNVWDGSGVEVMIDMDHNKGDYYDQYDYQFMLPCNSDTPQETKHNTLNGVKYYQIDTQKGYLIVAVFPWATLGKTPARNNYLGLDIAIDKAGADNHREAQVLWNSQDEQAWMYPDRFGDLQLVAGKDEPKR